MRQLPLPFDDGLTYAQEDLMLTAGTEAARQWLAAPGQWSNGRLVLWGEEGSGKTHLLHIWARLNKADVVHGSRLRGLWPAPAAALAVDDVDLSVDEACLFHLMNQMQEARLPLLMSARQPPARQSITLADLASRLRASTSVEVKLPDDSELASLLARMAAARQLVLDLPVQTMLLSRLARTPAALAEAVVRLDKVSLAGGGKITRALALEIVRDILHIGLSAEVGADEDGAQNGVNLLLNRHAPDG